MRRARGFSLLEAIVAMTLIAIAGMALFSWINASFETVNRLDAASARATAQMTALERIKAVNPMERPSGSDVIGNLRISWEARALVPAETALTEFGTPGIFTVALYEVVINYENEPQVPKSVMVVRQMGYRRPPGAVGSMFGDP